MGEVNTILITGATGFLGSHIVNTLSQHRYKIIVLKRLKSDTFRIYKNLDKVKVYNLEEIELKDIFIDNKIDTIIHCATEYGYKSYYFDILKANVIFPLELIEIGIQHKLKNFINTDTFFAKSEHKYQYLNQYTDSKRYFKSLLTNFSSQLQIVNMRIEHVFGENDAENKFVSQILSSLIENKDSIPLTNGSQKRDFIYVKDVVEAYQTIINSIEMLSGFSEFEVGLGYSISVKEFVKKMALATNSSSHLNFGELLTRPGEIINSQAYNEPLKALGWQPKYTIDDAILELVSSFQKN
jgi:nucleoside-diphosphate-sugar epimerase